MNMDAKFEIVSKYQDKGMIIPTRKTKQSAGYDFYAAEDVVIPSFTHLTEDAIMNYVRGQHSTLDEATEWLMEPRPLAEVADILKRNRAKVTLVPTGIKCKIPDGYFLQLSVRSSLPLKHWLILANGVGIIDADYYNNSDNEGHIYFQLINLLPIPVEISKGECFGQGILLPYGIAQEEEVTATREGGFGSTNE